MKKKKKVYIAGPDVFELDAKSKGKILTDYADNLGLIGLFPLDNSVNVNEDNADKKIFLLNLDLLSDADFVIANLNNFRGLEPDSGTVWEVAYAIAKGKSVIGYVDSEKSILDKVMDSQVVSIVDGLHLDKNNRIIENFGNKLNLMLEHSLTKLIVGNAKDALDYVANSLK